MKATICVLVLLLFVATAVPQTLSLGQGVFYSGEGDILIAVDASVAIRKIKSPYVMFRAYMVAAGGESIVVDRADVVMVWGGVEYRMPVYKEFQKAYSARQADLDLYRNLGKESLALSPMRNFRFLGDSDFFPVFGQTTALTNEGSMAGNTGFRTALYFKNPGFKKGDTIVIRVNDKKRPELTGSVAVVLE
jgi:hypothetical protein